MPHPNPSRGARALVVLALAAGCSRGPDADVARRADPALQQQVALSDQLAAQKDSLTRIILETDRFIAAVDSQVARAPGQKKKPVAISTPNESPVQAQLQERQQLLKRVQALVDRARATSTQLAAARSQIKTLQADAAARAAQNDSVVTELGATIERQLGTIQTLQSRVDSLSMVTKQLEGDTATLRTEVRGLNDSQARAWVIIGTERELLDKGVIVREGGTPLLVARVGRTLQPARDLKKELFTAIDIRKVSDIAVPDTSRRYEVVSRQALDYAEVADRDRQSFKGALHIKDPGAFWSASRYLILVQQ